MDQEAERHPPSTATTPRIYSTDRMVCGLCHRTDTDHPLSTSGPQRCKYTSHREDCPGGFRTKCTEHVLPSNKSEYFIDENLLNSIDNLQVTGKTVQPSNELMTLSTNQLQWLGIQPAQLQHIAQVGVHLGQQMAIKLIFILPISPFTRCC